MDIDLDVFAPVRFYQGAWKLPIDEDYTLLVSIGCNDSAADVEVVPSSQCGGRCLGIGITATGSPITPWDDRMAFATTTADP